MSVGRATGRQGTAHQREQVPQESGSCGFSQRHPRPSSKSSRGGEGPEQENPRSPGPQPPGKASPSSLAGSLGSHRIQTGEKQGRQGSRSQRGTAPSSPKGKPFGTTARGAPQRQEEKAEAPPQLPAWSSKALRREPWGLVPTRPRLLSWQDHSSVGAESPATPYAWPEPNRNHPCPPGTRATVCAPAPVTRRYTEAGEKPIPM